MISERDIKLLWARSGNRCAICRVELSHANSKGESSLIGEMAHIIGKIAGSGRSSRSVSPLDNEERDRYSNLILLCRNDHKKVDDNEALYPAEVLHKIKIEHELWVQESLGAGYDPHAEAASVIYAALIDNAISNLHLLEWDDWLHGATNPAPQIKDRFADGLLAYERAARTAVWPISKHRIESMERALKNLGKASGEAINHLLHNCAYKQDGIRVARLYYKEINPNPNYDRDLKKYCAWEEKSRVLLNELCRAANLFAEEVRLHFNPMFMVEHGKFAIRDVVYEYSARKRWS